MTRVLPLITCLLIYGTIFLSCPLRADSGVLIGAYFSPGSWGASVSSVVSGGLASKAGLKAGDRLISVDGRSIVEIGPAFDIALENDLLMGNSVLLEVLRETGYRDLVWIKTPRLTVAQRRYLPYYNDLRFVWGQAERIWWDIVQSYRFFLEGHFPVEPLATHVREGTEELQVMRNRILAIVPSELSGEEWEYLNSARDFMISSLFLMDQEAQRMPVESEFKVNLDGIKKRISQVEKYLNISLYYSGISRD